MSDVGDAIEIVWSAPTGATVSVHWIHTDTGTVIVDGAGVPEEVDDDGVGTGRYPVTLVGALPGMFEARFTAVGTVVRTDSYYERFDPPSTVVPLATLSEYTELYGALSTARATLARALLRRASQLVRDSFPGIDARITAGTVARDNAGLAVINMVARVLRNPGGLRSESTGPFSRSYDPEAASGMLALTDDETPLLSPPAAARGGRPRVGTIRITGNLVPPTRRRGWDHRIGGF